MLEPVNGELRRASANIGSKIEEGYIFQKAERVLAEFVVGIVECRSGKGNIEVAIIYNSLQVAFNILLLTLESRATQLVVGASHFLDKFFSVFLFLVFEGNGGVWVNVVVGKTRLEEGTVWFHEIHVIDKAATLIQPVEYSDGGLVVVET